MIWNRPSNGGVQPSGCIGTEGEMWFLSVKGAVHLVVLDHLAKRGVLRIEQRRLGLNFYCRLQAARIEPDH